MLCGVSLSIVDTMQDRMPLAEFLGPYVPPQNLTLDSLKSVAERQHGDFAAVIADATIRRKAAEGVWGDTAWCCSMWHARPHAAQLHMHLA